MKVFATLATILGVSSASPLLGNFGRHNDFRSMAGRHMPGRQMSDRQMSDMDMSGRQMSTMSGHQYSGMDQMQGRQDMHQMFDPTVSQGKSKGKPKGPKGKGNFLPADNMRMYDNVNGMSGRQYSDRHMFEMGNNNRQMSQMELSGRQYTRQQTYNNQKQGVEQGVDQYYKQDDFGNYAYGYANGNSEKFEVGNPQSGVKGHYTYVDSNGLNQKVEYVADDEGFRIVGKDEKVDDRQTYGRNMAQSDVRRMSGMRMGNQQHNRFTRSAIEPQVMRSQMTSYMVDFPSLVDDDLLQVERSMYRNGMSLNNNRMRFDNVMSDRQMYDTRDMFRVDGTNRNMYDNVMGNQQMSERPIIAQASYPIRPFNPIFGNKGGQGGQDRTGVVEKFPFYNDLGNQQMSERQMFNPIFGKDNGTNGNGHYGTQQISDRQMYAGGNRFFPSTFGLGLYSLDGMNMDHMRINDGVLGEQSTLSQRMEIERIPENTMVSYKRF